jgi:hypothetical protein
MASRRRREWRKAYSGERKRLPFGCITDSFAVRCCLPAERAEALFPGAFFVSFLCRHKEMKMKKEVKRNYDSTPLRFINSLPKKKRHPAHKGDIPFAKALRRQEGAVANKKSQSFSHQSLPYPKEISPHTTYITIPVAITA